MSPSRYSTVTEAHGSSSGALFDDAPSPDDYPSAVISAISIRHARLIDALEVYYRPTNSRASKHGGSGGQMTVFVLSEGEIITAVEGSLTSEAICHLTFVTNKRRCGPYGKVAGRSFTLTASGEGVGHRRMGLLSFSGRAGYYVFQLQAMFTEIPNSQTPSEIVKYERTTSETAREQSRGITRWAEQTPVSQFAGCLMSPTITLSAGPDGTKLYANEDTLARLPFFAAALQGGFKESFDKIINMPQDKPHAVAAMIEFLYTGSYSYAYIPTTGDTTGNVSLATLAEGRFHIAVCSTASKYGCVVLRDGALKAFKAVLGDTSDLERLRLWQAVYSDELDLPELKDDPQMLGTFSGQEELRRWIGALFSEYRDEMDTAMLDDQYLARDLLRLATVNLR